MKRKEIFNNTRDTNGQFQAGYRVTHGIKYVTIEYLTNIQGDRDRRWRLKINDYNEFKSKSSGISNSDVENLVYNVTQCVEPCWTSKPIR